MRDGFACDRAGTSRLHSPPSVLETRDWRREQMHRRIYICADGTARQPATRHVARRIPANTVTPSSTGSRTIWRSRKSGRCCPPCGRVIFVPSLPAFAPGARREDGSDPGRFPEADRPRDHALESSRRSWRTSPIHPPVPGVLGEALTAALNVNAMLWRTGPAATELELLTLDWLRQMLGLPAAFFGVIGDTASSNTLYALAAAREMHPELRIREEGMAGARRPAAGLHLLLGGSALQRRQGGDDTRLRLELAQKDPDRRQAPHASRMRSPRQSRAIGAPERSHSRWWQRSERHRRRRSIRCPRSPTSASERRCGCTSMLRMGEPRRYFRRCATFSRDATAPTRWW